MSVVDKEIREEQKQALSTMNTKQKLAYFWDYYKIHTLVAIIITAIAASLIKQYVTSKDYGFYAALINAVTTDSNYGLTEIWNEEFLEYAQIDPNEYDVYIDTSISMRESVDTQFLIANQQRLLAMLQTGSVSVIVTDTETFETYSQFEYFYDLESVFPEVTLEKYGLYLYYTDAATFDQVSDIPNDDESSPSDRADLVIDHRDPSTMEQPMAVGIILTGDNMIADAGYYAYLQATEMEYQGYPSDVVLGIPLTNKEPELVIRFLEYLKLGD